MPPLLKKSDGFVVFRFKFWTSLAVTTPSLFPLSARAFDKAYRLTTFDYWTPSNKLLVILIFLFIQINVTQLDIIIITIMINVSSLKIEKNFAWFFTTNLHLCKAVIIKKKSYYHTVIYPTDHIIEKKIQLSVAL